jgi:hypothetical protein
MNSIAWIRISARCCRTRLIVDMDTDMDTDLFHLWIERYS